VEVAATFHQGNNPGMMIRLDQSAILQFRNAMADFFPHYFNIDLELPSEYAYTMCFMMGICVDFKWDNIQYSKANLDVDDIKIDFTRDLQGWSLMYVDFPLLKDWKITAN